MQQSLAQFRIVAKLGEGGMGEVWRARDERLDREVALKLLPDAVASDPERLARFEREAKVLASLNHPNIAHLYGLEEADGRAFLVMELAEGEELAAWIERGAIPVDEAIAIARQIAEALEAAHEDGVIHRDLKPANVMIAPDGAVKVLDFGLAKTWAGDEDASFSMSPTLTAQPTAAGVILGTAAYMSPEQARGKPVDRRTDIWSFGVVLWEMLTGRKLFAGETVTDILAAVLKEAPDLGQLPAETPAALRRLIERCLVNDPKDRLRDIGEARIVLSAPLAAGCEPSKPPAASRPVRRFVVAAAVLGLAAGILSTAAFLGRESETERPQTRVVLSLEPAARLDVGASLNSEAFDISPDGRQIAFVGRNQSASFADRRLYVRDLSESQARLIPGTEGARDPSFSPNGQWIAFIAGSRLFRVPTTTGAIQPIATPQEFWIGSAAWSPEGWILAYGGVIGATDEVYFWRIAADSGAVEVLYRFERGVIDEGGEPYWIEPLPEDRGILFTLLENEDFEQSSLAVIDLESGEMRTLLETGFRPRYLQTGRQGGRLIYSREDSVLEVPFDLETLRTTGVPQIVLTGLAVSPIEGNAWYEASGKGDLVWIRAEEIESENSTMAWVSREGSSTTIPSRARYFVDPRVSPDGRKLAFSIPTGGNDIWVHDFARGTETRLSSAPGEDETPIWSADGEWIAWAAARAGEERAILRRRPDGSGATEKLWSSERHFHPSSWSSDGSTMLIDYRGEGTGFDIWRLDLDDPASAGPILAEEYQELHARLSPDGRWLSYTSNETGRNEVYIQSFPALDRKIQVSVAGGVEAVWSRDGSELVFRSPEGLSVVEMGGGAELDLSKPRLLFSSYDSYGKGYGHFGYDIAPDGRFLMAVNDTGSYPKQLELILDWQPSVNRQAE